MKKVTVNKDTCIGCGACVSISPKYFEFTDDGYSKAIKEVVEKEDEAEVEDAAGACPVSAIEIKED